jgi:putative heme iron utilization protein
MLKNNRITAITFISVIELQDRVVSELAAEMIEIGDVAVSTLGKDDNENCPTSTLYYQKKSRRWF